MTSDLAHYLLRQSERHGLAIGKMALALWPKGWSSDHELVVKQAFEIQAAEERLVDRIKDWLQSKGWSGTSTEIEAKFGETALVRRCARRAVKR
jgi:hypothetical protein